MLEHLFLPEKIKRAWAAFVLGLGDDIDPYRRPDTLLSQHKIQATLLELLETGSLEGPDEQRKPAGALFHELNQQRQGRGKPAFTIDNLPTGRLSSTRTPVDPLEFGRAGKPDLVAEVSLLAVNAAMGFVPRMDPGISDGAAVQHIIPRQGQSSTIGNAGTEPFGAHTEGAFQTAEEIPHGLTLLGLRNPTATATSVYILDTLLALLTPAEVKLLRQGSFTYRSGAATSDAREYSGPALETDEFGNNVWRVRAVAGSWISRGAAESQLIEKLIDILENPDAYPGLRYACVVGPGRYLFVNNQQAAHGRGAILDQFGKPLEVSAESPAVQNRWLLREQTRRGQPAQFSLP